MKSNIFIAITISSLIMIGCPAPQRDNATNQNTQTNLNNSNVAAVESPTRPNAVQTTPGNSVVQNKVPATSTPPPEPPKVASVTFENFNKLKMGMTYQEVVAILGVEGANLSGDVKIGGEKSGIYRWDAAGKKEAYISIVFQGDKLLTATQFGLK